MLLRRLLLDLSHFGVSDHVVINTILMVLTRCHFIIVTLHLLLESIYRLPWLLMLLLLVLLTPEYTILLLRLRLLRRRSCSKNSAAMHLKISLFNLAKTSLLVMRWLWSAMRRHLLLGSLVIVRTRHSALSFINAGEAWSRPVLLFSTSAHLLVESDRHVISSVTVWRVFITIVVTCARSTTLCHVRSSMMAAILRMPELLRMLPLVLTIFRRLLISLLVMGRLWGLSVTTIWHLLLLLRWNLVETVVNLISISFSVTVTVSVAISLYWGSSSILTLVLLCSAMFIAAPSTGWWRWIIRMVSLFRVMRRGFWRSWGVTIGPTLSPAFSLRWISGRLLELFFFMARLLLLRWLLLLLWSKLLKFWHLVSILEKGI